MFFLLMSYSASAQFYTKHYIAPAPWQYFSKANEIVIATNSTTTVNITLSKSNGTLVTNLTAVKGTPAVYRFAGLPKDAPAFALNTVLNGAGLIINASAPVSINLRNVASDALGGDGSDQDIKGNAALTSFGDAGIGIRFRVGYYRDGSLGNFGGFGDQRPIYSIMATVDNTTIKINNAIVTTLNSGQSYLFKAAIGTLVESSNPVVMNTSAAIDTPGGCGDGAFNQVPPESVLGTEYFIERGKGNDTAEQTTVVATKDNTALTIDTYSTTGALVGTTNVTLATAGSFYTFQNGVSNTSFSASRVFADKKVVVYSGTAQSCEVDISTIAPVSECGGSNFIETAKFRNYGTGSLPYFGYILLRSATDAVMVNGTNIETISGITARHQLGTTGWYIINFEDTQIGSPNILSISSAAKLTVSIVQQGGGFSMAGFFSNFAVQPEDPTMTYISGGGCTNNKAELTTPAGFAPYQWYFNGTAITGANSSTYTATKTGAYSVASTLTCGAQTQSKPVSVTLCTDLGITKTVDNATPCIGSNVEFTIQVSNLGGNNISGVSVNDLLPSGYTFVSSTPSVGSYDSATGTWSIGNLDAQTSTTLKIVATINASGNYTNTASLPSSIDTNTANNSASAAVTPKSSVFVVTNPAAVCAPSTVDITAPAVTAGSTPNMTLSYWTDANASTAYATPSAVTASGTYYIKAVSNDGCQFIKPVVVTINAQATTPTITASGSTTCATGSIVLTSSGNSGTYLWSTGETTKSITVTTNGSYTVKRINAAGCASNSSAATVVTFVPAAPTASAQTFCASENKKVSDLVASGTNLKWYTAATGGTALASTQTLTTGDYYGSQTVSGCESSRTQVSVTINTTSSAPVASAQTFCAADNKRVSDLVATGTNLKWYSASTGGTALPTNQILATGNYYVSQTANSCGESARTIVAVTVNTVPAAPTASAQTFCATDAKKVSDLVATGTNLKWYNASTNGTLYTGTETLVTGTYYVSQSTNSCGESPRTSVSVTVNNTAAPTASSQTFCAIEAKKVSDLTATGSNLKWYSANTGGTLYSGTETLTSGNYYVSQTLNSCESTRTLVVVTVNNTAAPTASSQTFCASDAKKVSDLTATGTNLKWYSASTGGTLYTGTETLISANYYVSQTLNSCESARTLVSVTVNPTPSAPTITADGPTTFCSGGSVVLTSSGGNSYLWSTGATTQSITVSASGNYSVRIGNASGCQSAASATTSVTVNPIPAVPTLGTVTQPTCSTATGSFTITNYSASNTYTISPSAGVTQSGNTITAPAGSYTVTATANGCTSAASTAAVVNSQPATPAVPTLGTVTQPTCSTATGSFTITNYSASNTYTVSPSAGVTQSGNTITAPAGSYTVTATANGCTSAASTAAVVNSQPATPAVPTLSAVTQPTCSTATGSFTITNYSASNTYTVSPSAGVTQSGNTITAPAGSYTVTATANGCTSGASSAAVVSDYICAEDDNPSSINGLIGGSISTVFANDKINGASFLPADVTLTTTTLPTGITFNSNGTINVAPNTPAGTYVITYTICKSTNPSICDPADVTVVITAPVIDAVTETTASVNGNTGGTTAALTANDTLNGNPVVIGTSAGQVTLTAVSVPSGLTLNANGTVTVAANTPAGTYDVEYTICEVTNPGNCDTVISKVVVGAAVIDAVIETTASVNGNTGGTTAALTANDTLNGNPVVIGTSAGQVTLTAVSVPSGLTLNANGTVTVAANTPAGTYDVEYTICEVTNPTNCDTVISKVVVGSAVIDAVTETTASVNGNTGGTTAALTANDTLNGNPVVIGTSAGQVTLTAVSVPAGLTLNADGTVTVAPNTPADTYDVQYTICEVTNPGNCDTVISKVVVTAGVLVANPDTIGSVTAGNTPQTLPVNVFDNDTKNGTALVPSDVTLTTTTADPTGYLVLNPDGSLTLGANAPADTYTLTYTICEKLNPSNCSSNTVTVTVGVPVIDAVTETTASVNGNTGGTTAALTANDTLNGNPVVIGTSAGQVTLTAVSVPAGLTLNADGTVTVAPNTPADTYDVQYTICEVTNPGNCDTVISKVVVTAGVLVANPDTIGSVTAGNTPQTLPVNVFDNDTKNGTALVPSDVTLTTTTADPTGYLVLNPDGSLTLGANAPADTYTLTYTICEKLNPSNCSSNTVTVTVGVPVIDAVTETTASVNGNTGGTTAALTANDTLNGNPVVIGTSAGQVTLTAVSVPAGLTLNANGTVTVAANTPAGTYDVQYTICEVTNPGNCDTVISKVVVGAAVIDAVTETTASVNGNTGGTTAALTANDTLNGNPVVIGTSAGQVTLTAVSVPAGLTLNADGTVTVAANTPADTYDVQYTICEVTNPGNCDTVISKVVVTAGVLVANPDTIGSVIAGNTPQTLPVNVFDNDTKNGTALVPSDVTLTTTTADPTGYLVLNPDGSLTLGANAPAGTYTLTYTICEKLNPSNCSSNTVTVTVGVPVIDAVTETTASVNGNTGGTTAALTANDTLNGNPVVIGTSAGQVTLTAVSVPAGLTLNANGTVTVAANTPAGTYDVQYTICEVTNPGNCDTVISKVVVGAAVIDAVTETTASVNGNTGGTTAALTANDTLNGNPVVIGTSAGQVTLTAVSVPAGLTLNADGTVTVASNTAAGTYDVEYTICEVTNLGNCDTVISKVVVGAAVIDAVTETTASVNGNTGGTMAALTANDTLNGNPVVIGTSAGQVTLTAVSVPTGLTLNANGTVTVAANTPAGTYDVEYTICEVTNPGNCDTVISKVVVTAGTLVANADTIGSVTAGNTPQTLPVNVFDNDTKNGTALVPSDVNLTTTTADPTGYLVLNPDGSLTLGANAPAGTYTLTYTICEKLNPTNCSSNTVSVTVGVPVIDAVTETTTSVNGNTGGTTAALTANDTLNGNPVVIGTSAGQVTLTAVSVPAGLTLNADGTVTVAPNTAAGTYDVQYTICEVTNPTNCDTVISKVVVTAGTLVANADTIGSVTAGSTPQTLPVNVFDNDTKNGTALVPSDVNLTTTTADPTGYLVLNPDGSLTLGANAPAGTYTLTYTICEKLNPSNCSSNTVTVTVGASTPTPVIDAITETTAPINGSTGGTTAALTANDTLNGNPVVIGTSAGQVTLTAISVPSGLTLNADGTVTVVPNTPAGIYDVEYRICEVTNPTNCDSVISKVVVDNSTAPTPVIDAVTETTAPINGSTGGTTAALTANDTLNGNPVAIGTSAGQVTLTAISVPSGLTLNADGTVTVASNTPAGIYDVEYRICEVTNPANCDAVISKVVVTSGALLQAIDDIVGSVVGVNHPQTIINIFDNDTNNGLPVVANDLNLSVVTPDPTGFLTVNPDGTVTLGANAPRGTYEVIYQICEKLNPTNCSSASVKVTVDEPTMTITANSYCSNNVPYVSYNVVPDNFTPNNLLTIRWIDSANNVVATQTNLPLSGNILWPGAVVDGSGNGVDWPGWINSNGQWTQGADGFENTRPAVTMEFSLNPTVSVQVNYPPATPGCNASPTFVIKANNDNAGPIDIAKGTSTGINVFTNDTQNGSAVIPANVTLSTVLPNASLILNADGTVDIKPGTQAGNYQLTYQICDVLNSSNCSQAIVSVDVINTNIPVTPVTPIVANNDGEIAVDGINGSLEFINVLDNDLLNGAAINPLDITITNTSGNSNFEFNADGTVNVKPNTPGGPYEITYQICEKAATTTNCASATLTVFVEVPAIAIVKTAVFNDENNDNIAKAGETITYKFVVTNTGNVPLKGITITDPLPGVIVSGQTIDLAVGESNDSNFKALYKITQTDINNGKVTNQASVKGSSAKGVVVEDLSDNDGINGDNPTVIGLNGCVIDVKKAFSPNGDQKNERFYIQGIECYPDNTVEIYNRWGVLVFEKSGYNNQDRVFKGYSEGRTTMKQSEGLPVGTYFYILKYKDSGSNPHEQSGYLYINK
ncbi:Ig-like domain-containing protein [Flavobacterium defluvii]|uniref:Ig-like domain-containing protein n=1 Tax=Flavobacterium defluvii TaxID=370979 RepID=UPI00142891BD|nr:gliding motility-associated C-terminal domain-containing protein [Flavobacterium defluvii]